MTNLPACHALRDRLVGNLKVSTAEFRRAISDEHWREYRRARQHVSDMRGERRRAQQELSGYFKLLSIADLKFHQSEKLSRTKAARAYKRMLSGRKAKLIPNGAGHLNGGDAYYERALEHLSELIERDRTLTQYLDKHWDWGQAGGMIGPDNESVPRLASYLQWTTIAESMLAVIDEAIRAANEAPEAELPEPSQPDIAKLKKLTALVRR